MGIWIPGGVSENGGGVGPSIYGVEWDGTSTTQWTRTDDAIGMSDPDPYYSQHMGFSDFDYVRPWSDIRTVEDSEAGTLVEIPKFWYNLEQTSGMGLKIQISDEEVEGFHVSPAHMDRGDGVGERDYIYVGRYHCSSSNYSKYKSVTRATPITNFVRATTRIYIHNLGTDVWQWDFATGFTIWLLYLVEFANWNSQNTIGYGCGNNSSVEAMGDTDSMPYHTGTIPSSRTTYSTGTQYRYIEGLWDNVFDWLDGCYYNKNGLNIILNPANFSDNSEGTLVGLPMNGYPSQFTVEDVNGTFPLFIPTASNGSNSTYSCDFWNYIRYQPCIAAGGYYSQVQNFGLFSFTCTDSSSGGASIGCRLMKLPSSRLS